MDADHIDQPGQHSLFDRISRQIAEQTAASPETAELPRSAEVDLGDVVAAPDGDLDLAGPDTAADTDVSPPGGVLLERSGGWPAPDISTQMERPIIANRQCSRSGCSDVAAVTLSYHYATSQVWIDHLTPERDPHQYDLCEHHAERLSVMRGWHLEDRRGTRRGALIAV